jgi:hypothetical protein
MWERDSDDETPVWQRLGADDGLVSSRDGTYNRKSESVPTLVVRPSRIEPLEGLKESPHVGLQDQGIAAKSDAGSAAVITRVTLDPIFSMQAMPSTGGAT